MPHQFNIEIFRQQIEDACEKAFREYRSGQTDRVAALARLDGIFDGAFAAARALHGEAWSSEMMDVVREATERCRNILFS